MNMRHHDHLRVLCEKCECKYVPTRQLSCKFKQQQYQVWVFVITSEFNILLLLLRLHILNNHSLRLVATAKNHLADSVTYKEWTLPMVFTMASRRNLGGKALWPCISIFPALGVKKGVDHLRNAFKTLVFLSASYVERRIGILQSLQYVTSAKGCCHWCSFRRGDGEGMVQICSDTVHASWDGLV